MLLTKRTLSFLLALCLILALVTVHETAFSQKKKEAAKGSSHGKLYTAKSMDSKAGTKDANIKSDKKVNTADAKATNLAPAEKGGKTRGSGGYTVIDNWTPWSIDIYADGTFKGTVAAWGSGWIYAGDCPSLYGRADFDDGSYKYWGPQVTCADTWKLNE